jgi:hypothetical protein
LSDAYFNRALVLKEQGKKALAVADLRECLELTSDSDLRAAADRVLGQLGDPIWVESRD